MSWLQIFLLVVGIYVGIGILLTFGYFLRSPYAENYLWVMIFLWPLLLFG